MSKYILHGDGINDDTDAIQELIDRSLRNCFARSEKILSYLKTAYDSVKFQIEITAIRKNQACR